MSESKVAIFLQAEAQLKGLVRFDNDIEFGVSGVPGAPLNLIRCTGRTPPLDSTNKPSVDSSALTECSSSNSTFDQGCGPKPHDKDKLLSRVGGMDISFIEGSSFAYATIVILEYPSLRQLYEYSKYVELKEDYVAGCLAYREAVHLLELLNHIKQECPEYYPQVLFIDGNGRLHPRQFGIACHIGVQANIPTIGVAKNLLCCHDGLNRQFVEDRCTELLQQIGDYIELYTEDGSIVIGAAFRNTSSRQPIYVSIGNSISLPTALSIVRICSLYRIPQPIRLADLISRQHVRAFQSVHSTHATKLISSLTDAQPSKDS